MNKEQITVNNEQLIMNKEKKALLTLLFVICYLFFWEIRKNNEE